MSTLPVYNSPRWSIRSESVTHLAIGWVLMLPLIFFAVHGNFSFQNAGNNNTLGGTALAGLASSGRSLGFVGYVITPGIAYSIVLWLIYTNFSRIAAQALQMRVVTLLALLTICSALWSQNPFRSFYNGVFYLIDTLFAFYLIETFDTNDLIDLAKMAGAFICIGSLVLVVFYPQIGVLQQLRESGAWRGLFIDRTSAAKCMVFMLSPAIIFVRQPLSLSRVVYILLLGCFIFMAHAVTALLVLFIYVLIMAAIAAFRKFDDKSLLLLTGLSVTLLVLVVSASLPLLPSFLSLFSRNTTLSGRTYVWAIVIRSIMKRPILGYGFYAFWQGMTGESANTIVAVNWTFGYAHNGILELMLQLGLLGTTVFFVTLVQALRNAWICLRNRRPSAADWYVGLIVLTILYNVDEATVVWPNELLSILYVVACCGLARSAGHFKRSRALETA
jgi:exopolysaccharide production protein ExoQ